MFVLEHANADTPWTNQNSDPLFNTSQLAALVPEDQGVAVSGAFDHRRTT